MWSVLQAACGVVVVSSKITRHMQITTTVSPLSLCGYNCCVTYSVGRAFVVSSKVTQHLCITPFFLPSFGAEFAKRTRAKAPLSPFVQWKRLWGFQWYQ